MENASKALIIAGAILLSILIISLGLVVFNTARNSVGNVNLSEHEIATFNQKFDSYEGNNVSGTSVNALIQAVVSSNIAAARDVTGQYIKITYPAITGTTLTCEVKTENNQPVASAATSTKVPVGKTYKVEMKKDNGSGLINEITVTAN